MEFCILLVTTFLAAYKRAPLQTGRGIIIMQTDVNKKTLIKYSINFLS
jgi:hypothetical protein